MKKGQLAHSGSIISVHSSSRVINWTITIIFSNIPTVLNISTVPRSNVSTVLKVPTVPNIFAHSSDYPNFFMKVFFLLDDEPFFSF